MTEPEYVSLHTHTHNSMLDGYSKDSEYIQVASDFGMRGLGQSDHGNVFGLYGFIKKVRDAGMIPVPGCEFYMAPVNPEGAKLLEPVFYGNNGKRGAANDVSAGGAYLHITVWAYNNVGLTNLFKLSTLSNDPAHFFQRPRIDFGMLADHAEGLVVATGCPSSEISTRFLLGQDQQAYNHANQLKEVFQDKLFMEIMDHNMPIDLERTLLPKQLEMARKLQLPLLATNDCHYAHKKDFKAHEEMLCVQSGSRMSDATYDEGGRRFAFSGDEYYLKSAQEMAALFPADEFPDALTNSLAITEMASDINLKFNPHLKPRPVIPPEFHDEVEYYRHLLKEGFKQRYGGKPREIQEEAMRRNKHEFEVIHSSDFIGYMLVVRDYLVHTRDLYSTKGKGDEILASSIGVGRGSIGGSIHAYELGISEIDPIEHDLIFERFLSAGRGATYQLTYEDGSSEQIIVSGQKGVVKRTDGKKPKAVKRYIHQLSVGDEVFDVPVEES